MPSGASHVAAPPASRIERFVSRPVHLARSQRALERFNLAIDSFKAAPDLREFLGAFTDNGPAVGFNDAGDAVGERGEDQYARLLTATIQQIGRMHYVSLARRRTAALALALHLYHAEHGAWPAAEISQPVLSAVTSTAVPAPASDAPAARLENSSVARAPSEARSSTHAVPVAEACTDTTVSAAPPANSIAGAATETATGSADNALASDSSVCAPLAMPVVARAAASASAAEC